MTLGAAKRDVLTLIVRQGMQLALVGLGAGLIAALLPAQVISTFMTDLLVGVSAADPLTYLATAVILTAVALAATWVPARRAISTDPSSALRAE